MKSWTCPKCGDIRQFIDHPSVKAWHMCNTRIPRRTPMQPDHPSTDGDNQGNTPKPKRKQKT